MSEKEELVKKVIVESSQEFCSEIINKYEQIMNLAWEAARAIDSGEPSPICPFTNEIDVEFYNREISSLLNRSQQSSEEEIELEERIDNFARVLARLKGQGLIATDGGIFTVPKDKELSKGQLEDIQWLMDEYDYGFKREE